MRASGCAGEHDRTAPVLSTVFCTLLQAVALNLMCQLGGLCAAHTRKATILQGEIQGYCHRLQHLFAEQVQRANGLIPGKSTLPFSWQVTRHMRCLKLLPRRWACCCGLMC